MEGKVEDKTQSTMQNLGNERERILEKFPGLLVHISK
jgi:hypothetical protein